MRASEIPRVLALVLAMSAPLGASAQEEAKRPNPAPQPAEATAPKAAEAAEPQWLNESAVGLVTDEVLDRTDAGNLVCRDLGVLFIGWDLPQVPIGRAIDIMTPEAIAKHFKFKGGTLVAKETLEVDDSKAVLLRLLCGGDGGDRSVLLLLVGDERFSSAVGVIGQGAISDEQFTKVRKMLADAWWDSDALAASLTDNLSFHLQAPLPLRFGTKSKTTVIFTDAFGEKMDTAKFVIVTVQEELKPARLPHPAYNMNRFKVFAEHVANPRAPKHDEFKWREFNALTTRVEADPVQGEGQRVAIVTSIFMPDRVITLAGAASQARADELAGAMKSMVDSIAFFEDDKKPDAKAQDAPEKK